MSPYELSAGLFVRGLSNLKTQLQKAEAHAAASGCGAAALLNARLGVDGLAGHPRDLHRYTLAAHAHWAAEGARLAIAQLLGAPAVPVVSVATGFSELQRHLDETISYLRERSPSDLEAGLDRMIDHPRASTRVGGGHFLLAFAVPHFFYHLTAACSILRNQGVELTMGDFLGDWAAR